MPDGTPDEIVTVWRSTGQAELDLIAASRWRMWPPPSDPTFRCTRSRGHATKTARELHVPREGVGYVVEFDLRREFLERHDMHRVEGTEAVEYRIPAADLGGLNENLVGAIREETDYRGPVPDADFEAAARYFGAALPQAWRAYLQGRSWFRRGWISAECYVWLWPPLESVEMARAWGPATPLHPGIAMIGSDGGPELLALDLRRDPPPVMAVGNVSPGWHGAVEQAATVEELIERIEDGSFEFRFE